LLRRTVSGMMLTLLFVSVLTLAFNPQLTKVEPKLTSLDHYPKFQDVLDPNEQTTRMALETSQITRTIRIVDAEKGLDSITLGSPTHPMPAGGYPFTVNITLNGTTDYLHSFQIAVAFNKTKVKCAAAWIPKDDPNFVFYGESPIMGYVGVYNNEGSAVLGSLLFSDYVVPDHTIPHYVNVSGEKLLCQIDFAAIETGVSSLEILTTEEPTSPWNTTLMDTNNHPINFVSKKFSVTAVALQPPVVAAHIRIQPYVLNLKSRGKRITCYIELPEGFNVRDINISSILLNDTIPAKPKPKAIGDYDRDGIPDLMVKFDRAKVISYILANVNMTKLIEERFMTITLTVTGRLKDGTPFQGSDTITILYNMPRRHGRLVETLKVCPSAFLNHT
jgi:hypothetical protein